MKPYRSLKIIKGCVLLGIIILTGCHSFKSQISLDKPPVRSASKTAASDLSFEALKAVLYRHASQSFPGAKVLAAALLMLEQGVVVKGSCWGYVNAVYDKAGFPPDKRKTVFKSPEQGPYADPSYLKPGDWVMYRNLPYGEIGHSAIFVEWIDFYKRSALTVEYAGLNRLEPGRLREADLTKVYQILRANAEGL